MKNIYILGKVIGKYRTQNLIKALLDNEFNVYYNSLKIRNKVTGVSLYRKILRKFLNIIENIIILPQTLYFLTISDIIILPAMNIYEQFWFNVSKKIFRKKIIVDYYVSYYDSLVLDRKSVKYNSLKAKKLMKFDRNILINSDRVIFLNQSEKKYYLKVAGIDESEITYSIIPLCIDESIKVTIPYFKKKDRKFKICWWGSYIPLHGVEKIIEAAQILKNRNFNYEIFLFGNSEQKSIIYKNLILQKELNDRVKIYNDFTFKNGKLNEFLISNCDLVLGNFGESEKAKAVLVNKLIDAISMKAPVLTGESEATNEFFNFKDDIWKCKNDGKHIADAIIDISQKSLEEIENRVNNSYEIYKNNFSQKIFKERLISIIEEV